MVDHKNLPIKHFIQQGLEGVRAGLKGYRHYIGIIQDTVEAGKMIDPVLWKAMDGIVLPHLMTLEKIYLAMENSEGREQIDQAVRSSVIRHEDTLYEEDPDMYDILKKHK